jgi:leucyl-tRNA synthetase
MTKEGAGLRTGPKSSYHDKVFEEEINNLINITKEQYEKYVASLST